MKMKLSEVAGYFNSISSLANKKLPAKISYAVMKNQKALEEEFKGLEQQRLKFCGIYAEKDENEKPVTKDGAYVFSEKNKEDFHKEYRDVLEEEIEMNIHMVSISELDKCDESDRYDAVTPADVEALAFMLKE